MPGTSPDLPTVIGDLDMQLLGLLGHTAILSGHDLVVLDQLRTTIGRVLAEAGKEAAEDADQYALAITAGELWDNDDPEQHPELSARQIELLDASRRLYQEHISHRRYGAVYEDEED